MAHWRIALLPALSALTLSIPLVVGSAGAAAAPVVSGTGVHASAVTSTSLGQSAPTFAGPAATGCNSPGCSLLTGPFVSPAITSSSSVGTATPRPSSGAARSDHHHVVPAPRLHHAASTVAPPAVSCQPLGSGCDAISSSAGGAVGVKGLNAVDSSGLSTNFIGDIEPPDQGLCAGNGYVVEANNIGEVLVFNTALQRKSSVIPLDTVMGLTSRGWSSGGDPACLFDAANGGHWFFTEFVSASTEASGGPFAGCFAAVANTCYEGIAVSQGNNPFGPYNVYFLNADYNSSEPGYPYLLNDYAKIATTRDAFLLFYDEFPLNGGGFGGGFFNGAQEFAFDKNALEEGLPVTKPSGKPNPAFNVAIENMGLLPTPDGTCASSGGATCWYQVIPAQPPDPSQYDNSNGGSGFMLASLDFVGHGDNRLAAFDWTGLGNLNSTGCSACGGIRFGGQLFSGVLFYYGVGFPAAQKAGPIPLGEECGAAGLTVPASNAACPEGGIATNGDGMTQVSQAQGQLWGAISTEIDQTYATGPSEVHQGALYWVIGTGSFDTTGRFTLTSQHYVSAAHEDIEFPTMAAEGSLAQDGGNGGAIMAFTLSGNGGPTRADNGGFFPSTAYGRLTSTSNGLSGSLVNVADAGLSPQDGFTEYLGYPTQPLRPRWGDYGAAVYLPGSGGIYFANEYIQYPNCTGSAFTLTLGTCGGTRDGYANWGTSVNFVTP